MEFTIFSEYKGIYFVRKEQTSQAIFSQYVTEEPLRERVIELLRDAEGLYIVSENPCEAYRFFAAQFTEVEAAGGVVACGDKVLAMRRNGNWDLPKGHLEVGESLEECAARETAEECGLELAKISVKAHIVDTLHFYYFPRTSRWELKTTHWYAMDYDGSADTKPQTEEGITEVEWIDRTEIDSRFAASFGTIRTVIANYKQMKYEKH